jgi:class 3 adenylate cyclase/tetratricopeptide (TPR) repeat protein
VASASVELRTIYLVDLVGSTRLEASVGPARADALRVEFFEILHGAIEASGGEEFKNTGDGMFAAFVSTSAAVACAVLTQQLLERRFRGAEHPLRVRIGLSTGEATISGGDYFGLPSVEAARLCDKAPPDGIFASPATRLLAGRVDGARFESAGAFELKGIQDPMDVFSVAWEPLDPERAADRVGRWPIPDALRGAPRVSYVGRRAERTLLDEARARARAASRQLVLLSGEPGIGKTRLASHAALTAHADGFAVCWGACSEALAAPYEPWIAVCTQVVEHLADDVLTAYVERSGGDIGRVAHNLARRLPGAPAPRSSDPETERLMLFNAVTELLRAAAGAVPICLVLDDFHWADAQSVSLLGHVARTVGQSALQILVTYRHSDVARDHPLPLLLADLRRVEGVRRMPLTGLGTGEIAQLLQALAGHDLDADGAALSAELAAETGGNPFFVGEIVLSMAESGALAQDADTGRWHVDRASLQRPPESVREVIDRRVDRLGARGREILGAAAVIGRSFDVALLSDTLAAAEADVLDTLEAAVTASLVRESPDEIGRFTFEHALISHTLYAGTGATRRARLHRQVAEALERHLGAVPGARVGELAGHWAKAAPADTGMARRYARLAGEDALAKLAAEEALRWFAAALALLPEDEDPALRCDLLIGLGEAQRRAGNPSYRQTLLDAGRIAGDQQDGPRAAAAALANTRGQTSVWGRIDKERIAAIERALALDDDPDRRARLLAIEATELLYEPDAARRRALAEEALDLARAVGRTSTTAAVLIAWFRVHQTPDGLQERLRHVDELEAVTAQLGDSPTAGFATAVARNALVEGGLIDRGRRASDRIEAIAARLGDQTLRWITTYSGRACWELLRGDLAAAERHADEALRLGTQAGEPDVRMMYGAQIIPIRILQGRADEVLELLEQSIQANPRLAGFAAVKAQILALLGRTDDAREILADATRLRFAHVSREQTRSVTLAMYAEAAATVGDVKAAAVLYELLEPAADQVVWNGANTYGHQRTYLGLLAASLGRDEQADEHFARAIELQGRAGLLVWAARAHLGWAEALTARGEHERAREHAHRVLALSREHGYGLFEPRAAAILDNT